MSIISARPALNSFLDVIYAKAIRNAPIAYQIAIFWLIIGVRGVLNCSRIARNVVYSRIVLSVMIILLLRVESV